jgi:hypothetical protein
MAQPGVERRDRRGRCSRQALLDRCLPQTPGVPVDGQIDAPSGSAAPMDAQCSISLVSEGGFLDAHVLVLVPVGLTGV